MRATLALILAMGGTLQMAGWRLFRIVIRVEYPGWASSPLSRQRLRPAKVLKLNVVDDVSGEHDER